MIKITDVSGGCCLPVLVTPRSSVNKIEGEVEGELKVRITAPPVEGEANRCLCDYLALRLGVARSQVSVDRGQNSRHKMVRIHGLTAQEVKERLGL